MKQRQRQVDLSSWTWSTRRRQEGSARRASPRRPADRRQEGSATMRAPPPAGLYGHIYSRRRRRRRRSRRPWASFFSPLGEGM